MTHRSPLIVFVILFALLFASACGDEDRKRRKKSDDSSSAAAALDAREHAALTRFAEGRCTCLAGLDLGEEGEGWTYERCMDSHEYNRPQCESGAHYLDLGGATNFVACMEAAITGYLACVENSCSLEAVWSCPLDDRACEDEYTDEQKAAFYACDNWSAPSCTVDTDCLPGQECDEGTCFPTSEFCEFDTDCDDHQACHLKRCTTSCTSTAECEGDEQCVPRPGNEEGQKICLVDDGGTPTGCDPACGAGEVCVDNTCVGQSSGCISNEECGGNAVCDDGQCVSIGPNYYSIEIHDVSPANRCPNFVGGEDSSGAEIMYVMLSDANTGATLAYGSLVGHIVPMGSEVYYNDAGAVLNGQPPHLTGAAEGCIHRDDFTTANIVALDCGGSVIVDFRNANGNRIPLSNTYMVTVGEYGNYCNGAFGDDFYEVNLCTDSAEVLHTASSCSHPISNASTGVTTHSVTLPQ